MALFFFLLLLISHREQLLLVQGHQMFLRLREIGQAGGYPRLTSPSINKKPLPRGEQKLQDEYVLDSRIHSRLDPPWNFRNLQKHSRGGLVLLKDHKVLKWQDRGGL